MNRQEKNIMRDPATVNCRLYIGNLNINADQESLVEHFQKYGKIVGSFVQRTFGFIQYEEESSAQEAIKNENGVMFQGRKLKVKQAFENKNKLNDDMPEAPIEGTSDVPPKKIPRRSGSGPHEDYRDGAGYYGRPDGPYPEGSNYNASYTGPDRGSYHPDRPTMSERNDCEIIVVSKALTEYAEYIEQRLKQIGLTVDLLFPMEDVPIGRVLANISSRGCLYAVLVMPQNEEHRSLTLNILHGLPQEHRNMPVDDAISLITRNFDAYMRGIKTTSTLGLNPGPVSLTDRHPEPIQILLNLLAVNRQLTTLQYDRIIKYLQEKRELQYKQEIGDGADLDKEETTKQAELQNRIMSILNQTGPGAPSPVAPPIFPIASTTPVPKPAGPILLNDPSIQKALDSLMQGDLLKNITSETRY